MAVNVFSFYLFVLLLYTTLSKAAADRRFSDFKRCADEECSMLLCRGKAAQDFIGPDCRFLSFKKGETIYVYYKLSGKRADAWAGSVGSRFGYFPKDLLLINHVYTDKELEVPAEETDFVCFDSGFDKFDNYDLEILFGSSVLSTEDDDSEEEKVESEGQQENDHSAEKDSETVDDNGAIEDFGREDNTEEVGEDRELDDLESMDSSHLPSEMQTKNEDTKGLETDMQIEIADESIKDDLLGDENNGNSFSQDLEPESTSDTLLEVITEPLPKEDAGAENLGKVSERQVPDLKTTLGSTFDVVASDDEETRLVTPYYDEEEREDVDDPPSEHDKADDSKNVPLLSFSEENAQLESEVALDFSHSEKEKSVQDSVAEEQKEEKGAKENKSMWTSLGDTVFAIVSGGEMTNDVSSSEEEGEEDDLDSHTVVDKAKDQETDHVQLMTSNSDPEVPSQDEFIFEEPSEDNIEISETDVPDSSLNDLPPQEKIAEEILPDEPASEMEGQSNSVGHPDSSTAVTEEEPGSPDEGKLDFQTIPGESPQTLAGQDETFVPEQENVTLENSAHSEGQSPEDDSDEKVAIEEENVAAKRDEQTAAELNLEMEPDMKTDQNIRRAKKELKSLFENTLEREKLKPSSEEEEEEEELEEQRERDYNEEEELLEDENAMLSSSIKDHLDTKEEDISSVNADAGTKEPQTDVELEESNAKHDTIEIEETFSNPSIVEDHGANAQSAESRAEKDSDSADYSKSHLSSLELRVQHKNEKLDGQEVEYSQSVKQLTVLRSYFEDKDMDRIRKYLSPQHLFRVEVMFTNLEQELKAVRQSQSDSSEDIEKTLEGVLEASETSILDEIERMLDARELKSTDLQQMDGAMFDEEAAILDDFQELAFRLRQRYSTVSDSEPLASENQSPIDKEEEHPEVLESLLENLTTTATAEEREIKEPLDSTLDSSLHAPDRSFEEDGGHFNKNKENQGIFKEPEEIQKGPQAILENPLDVGFGFEVEQPSSGSLDTASVSDFREEDLEGSSSSSILSDIWSVLLLAQECFGVYSEMLIAALPEEWQPGPTFHGLPWRAVASTVAVGIITFLAFIWRTVLAVKSKTYLLTEKQLAQKITQLCDEKSEALAKISDLKKKIVECEEQLKESEKSACSSQRENAELKESFRDLQKRSQKMSVEMEGLNTEMAKERRHNMEQNEIISKTEKEIEKLKRIIKGNKEELSKVQVHMDEARIREEALKAQVTSFQKENTTLKDKKKSLLREARDWEEKHKDLSDKIKVFQKSQKELEDTLEHKENEIEVLSDCIAELRQLEACDSAELQKGGAPVLANGEAVDKKSDAMKNRIKQMMDVSRVKTTLSIVEDERNRYLEKLLTEEKQRHELEEQIKKLEHDRASLQGEKCQLENQFNTIQQKLEIMNELYQQKENALQQKLTQEEFERREKETKLSEVDGKALRAEEELRAYKLRIQEIEEELQKTERSYKTQIAAHEKKAHENWLNARASERALVEEKRETANLRQKLVEVNDKLAEFQRPLFKPTPGRPDQQIPPHRRGDSYGPSPLSGGAPSPPLMIEGPGRPPSAPVGRRNEPFGRPPSEPHGRYSDLGHPLPPRPADVCGPRTSSPSSLDASQNTPVESEAQSSPQPTQEAPEAVSAERINKSQGSSFLGSPIRDFPVPGLPPKGPGPIPPPMGGPHLPPGQGPPPPMPAPLNGHPPMIPPGAPGHDPRLPPPRPGPGMGPYGPPRPYIPLPPPYIRGPPPPMRDYPMGPPPFGPQDFHPEMREPLHGPRDYPGPPRPLPPGAIPPPGPPGGRDHTGPGPLPPPQPHMGVGPRNFPEGPHHGPDTRRDSIPPQTGGPPRDTPTTQLNGP